MPSWSDKLVGEVVRLLLEAYYEPQFSDRSHGFRKGRGCHTALREIKQYLDRDHMVYRGRYLRLLRVSLDHEILLGILAEKIHDQRFLRLIRNMLKAGYLEDWEYRETLSGCPQGGVVSPILSNIYLDKLDEFVEQELIPQYTRGASRRRNPEYSRMQNAAEARAAARGPGSSPRPGKAAAHAPLGRPDGPRLPPPEVHQGTQMTTYWDSSGRRPKPRRSRPSWPSSSGRPSDWNSTRHKTLITHARSQRARFLGYDISVQHCNTKITSGRRSANGKIALRVPPDVIKAQCARYRQHGKPWHRSRLQNLDDYDIVRIYGAEYRGVVNYYLLAQDVWRLSTPALERPDVDAEDPGRQARSPPSPRWRPATRPRSRPATGCRTCFEARKHREGKQDLVARFGGIILRQDRRAVIRDPAPGPGSLPPQGADHTAPQAGMRAVRDRHHGGSPPGHRPQGSSGSRDRASPRGPPSWRKCGARRSSSAPPAMTGSTRTPSRTRHKSLESPVH